MRTSTALQVLERRKRVWDLRRGGASIGEIAKTEAVSYSQIQKDLQNQARMLDTTKLLQSEMMLSLDRLDVMFKPFYISAQAGDADSARVCLAIMDRRIKLLGLDAPKRIDVRLMIEEWARREGLEADDVLEAVWTLLPSPVAV